MNNLKLDLQVPSTRKEREKLRREGGRKIEPYAHMPIKFTGTDSPGDDKGRLCLNLETNRAGLVLDA